MNERPVEGYYWAQRDNRFDVYPQEGPLVLVRVENDGPWSKLFDTEGNVLRVGYRLVQRVPG